MFLSGSPWLIFRKLTLTLILEAGKGILVTLIGKVLKRFSRKYAIALNILKYWSVSTLIHIAQRRSLKNPL